MPKVSLNTIGSRYGSIDALNDNFDAIEAAIENTLSLDGTSPNAMTADLDLNSNDLLNVGTTNTQTLYINGIEVEPNTGVSAGSAFQTYSFTATAGQTTFSVAPATPLVSSLLVSVNGLELPPADVTVSTTNVVIPACTLGDEVVVRRFTKEPTVYPTAATQDFQQAGTGAQIRTVQSKLRDVVSVNDFGADNTGVTGSSTGINAALASGAKQVIARGTYLLDADLLLPDNVVFDCRGAHFKASANGRTMIKSSGTPSSYYSQVLGGLWDGDGKTSVTAMDFSNMRIGAGVYSPRWKACNIGLIARTGCFGMVVENPGSEAVKYPMQVLANASTLVIRNPAFDNSPSIGGDGTGIGIDIRAGAGDNIGVRVEGGYVQGFDTGVKDAGIKTVVDAVYVELNTYDVDAVAARASHYRALQHYGPSGTSGYRLRNCDAVCVYDPTMASGARTGLFDADGTNTNCRAFMVGSNASLNTPLGTVTGLLLTDYTVGFTVTDASGAALSITQNKQAYRSTHGLRVTIDVDITYPTTASGATAAITLPVAARSGSAVSGACGYTDYGSAVFIDGSGSSVNFYNAAGAALTNANLSGKRLVFSLSYVAQ